MSAKPHLLTWGISAVLLTGLVACATQPVAGANAASARGREPGIYFAEPFFDFGRVQSETLVTHDFVFTNTGSATLEISDVYSSCGCTAVTNWDRRVGPGKTGMLHVLFNSGGMAGPVEKEVWITCNDPVQPTVYLVFTASVWKWIDAIPTVAAFAFGPDFQTNETRVIRLVSNLGEPVALSAPVCTNRSFKAELETVRTGKEFELRVMVVPPLGPGSVVAPITLKTSSPKMPVVTVSAYALAQPALTVIPPRIMLPPTPLAEASQFNVTIQNNGTNPLTLSAPSINAEGAGVRLREIQPQKLFDLAISFPAGFRSELGRPIEASVKSNKQQSPIVKVPVIQLEPSAAN